MEALEDVVGVNESPSFGYSECRSAVFSTVCRQVLREMTPKARHSKAVRSESFSYQEAPYQPGLAPRTEKSRHLDLGSPKSCHVSNARLRPATKL